MDQNCLSQSLMRVQIELGRQPGWGTNPAIKASHEIFMHYFRFLKYVMLIYVSCETPEQISDCLYFELRSLFYMVQCIRDSSFVQNVVYMACVQIMAI